MTRTQLAAAGVELYCPGGNRGHGVRDFAIKDPDENQIGIAPFFMQAPNTSVKGCPKAVPLGLFVPSTVSPGVLGKSLRSVYWMPAMLE
jgi:hypothetical protein